MRIQLAHVGSPGYRAGRRLAEQVYREAWNTPSLTDHYALGVIAWLGERAVGNINLLSRATHPLPSERYFVRHHWREQFDVPEPQIGEVGSLAIARGLDFESAEVSLMGMLHVLCVGARLFGIRLLSTVQHRALSRKLVGYLGLPLVANTTVTEPSRDVPDDVYWQLEDKPQIYYMNLLDPRLTHATALIQAYLVGKQVRVDIGVDQASDKLRNYAAFRQQLARTSLSATSNV